MASNLSVTLLKNRDKPVRFGHPWIFSGAIARPPETKTPGIVRVLAAGGEEIGQGFYTPNTRLAVRMLARAGEPTFSEKTILSRLKEAMTRRSHLFDDNNNAARIVFAESDFLPGLVADRFGETLSVQLNTAFAETYRDAILNQLQGLLKPWQIVDTSDNEARNREGLAAIKRSNKTQPQLITSRSIRYQTAIGSGQKTGFYLDQATNRGIIAAHAKGRRVLDAFCYSGGFSLSCYKAGAKSVTAIDSSADALQLLQQNLELNRADLPADSKIETINADVFDELRRLKSADEKFDLIVLDPPKLAPSRGKADAAEKAYKDLNLQGLHLAAPGALLATFSCSGAMTFEKLRQILHYAAHDAGKNLQILQILTQAEDHPILLAFPESEYLRGYLCRVY